MDIKVLGTGCPNCQKLKENVQIALDRLGLKDVKPEHIDEIDKIIEYGVLSTPAVVVDGEVRGMGKVFTPEEIELWLK